MGTLYAAPQITGGRITNIDLANGTYSVEVDVTAEAGLDYVQFPSWTLANGQDDLGTWPRTAILDREEFRCPQNTSNRDTIIWTQFRTGSDYLTLFPSALCHIPQLCLISSRALKNGHKHILLFGGSLSNGIRISFEK